MSKGDQNFLKIQTCVLKVHIHCDGCKQKVKKLLQKIDGVYTVSIDPDHGKVTVSGSVDPSTLIKKLSKSGKHAELLAPKGGSGNNNNNNKNNNISSNNNNFLEQLQKLKLEGGQSQQKDNGKPQKGKGGDSGGGAKDKKGQQPPQNMFKDLKLPQLKGFNLPPPKDQKNVKFSLPDDFDDGSDFDDDEFDDYDDDDDFDDLDGIDDDDDFDDVLKPMNAKAMSDNKKGNDKKGGEKSNGGKKDGKTVEKDNKGGSNNNGKNSKKGGEKNEVPAMNPKMMGHGPNIGNGPIGAIQGLPQGAAIQGMPVANPYQQQQQQQYMAMMRQQQQQQQMMMNMNMNMNNGPTVYGQPMGFMPAPPAYAEPYTNYFSDENTNSGCSVM